MEPLMFVMAILGCGDGVAPCQEVRVAEARYQSQADCVAATGIELIRHDDLPYPVVVAQCRQAGAAAQPLRGSEVNLPDAEALPQRAPRFAEAGAGERAARR